jgi:hypothetical protein
VFIVTGLKDLRDARLTPLLAEHPIASPMAGMRRKHHAGRGDHGLKERTFSTRHGNRPRARNHGAWKKP